MRTKYRTALFEYFCGTFAPSEWTQSCELVTGKLLRNPGQRIVETQQTSHGNKAAETSASMQDNTRTREIRREKARQQNKRNTHTHIDDSKKKNDVRLEIVAGFGGGRVVACTLEKSGVGGGVDVKAAVVDLFPSSCMRERVPCVCATRHAPQTLRRVKWRVPLCARRTQDTLPTLSVSPVLSHWLLI